MVDQLKPPAPLLTVSGDHQTGKVIVAIHEGMEPMGAVQAGILLADIARNIEKAWSWDLEEMVVAFEREMGRPTDIPVEAS